jgi:hypothetical protein
MYSTSLSFDRGVLQIVHIFHSHLGCKRPELAISYIFKSTLLYIYHLNPYVLIISFTGVVPNDLVDIRTCAFRVALVHHSDALQLADEVFDTTVDLSTLGPAYRAESVRAG